MTTTATTTNGIRYSVENHVAVVSFDRSERRNAVSLEMQREYVDALLRADADPDVRAIVITGEGTAFCAGADLGRLNDYAGDPAAREAIGPDPEPRYVPLTLNTPVIAAVNGPAVGLGLVYAVFSDVRFAGESGMFSAPFSRLGLVSEYGLSWLLPRMVSPGDALDMLLSGRAVGAAEALRMGLVQRVVPDDELRDAAVAYARELADRCSPRSLAIIRRQVYGDLSREFLESFHASLREMGEAFKTPDVSEGLAAFREKRLPNFPAHSDPRVPFE